MMIGSFLVLAAAMAQPAASPAPPGDRLQFWMFDWRTPRPAGDAAVRWLHAQESHLKTGDGCQLFVSWKDDTVAYGSALHNVALFVLEPSDTADWTHLVENAAPGIDVRLGVRYHQTYEPWSVHVAMAFEGPSENVFSELSRTEASTLHHKSWKPLQLIKPLRKDNYTYTFTFSCESGRSFLRALRRLK